MKKKYKLKDKIIPNDVQYFGLSYIDFVKLNKGKKVELDKVPAKIKTYIVEIKSKEVK
tara:strand:- start:348 stop:521 length:174 start_codon:yes stop_codon:yes gene_type:complete